MGYSRMAESCISLDHIKNQDRKELKIKSTVKHYAMKTYGGVEV
jgi:hypothetical protein